MNIKLQKFCNQVVQCLVRYGKLEESKAQKLVDESQICEERTELGIDLLSHDTSYYWAMDLLYGRDDPNNYWFHNPDLWPPPADYYDWLNELDANGEH